MTDARRRRRTGSSGSGSRSSPVRSRAGSNRRTTTLLTTRGTSTCCRFPAAATASTTRRGSPTRATSCARSSSRRAETVCGEPVCSFGGRDPLVVGTRVDRAQRLADALERRVELWLLPALMLDAEQPDSAPCVDDVVRRVEDLPFVQALRIGRLGQLIVRRAGDDTAAQAADRVRVQRCAEGTGRVHVTFGVVHRVGWDDRVAYRGCPL